MGGDSNTKLPFWKQVVAGGGAGIIEIMTMYPTDVIKTRGQLAKGSHTMWELTKNIVKDEGPLNLYRGILAPIFAEAPKRAVKFSMNEQYKTMLKTEDGSLPWNRATLAGALAGSTETFVNCPFECIKVRMQAKENLGRFSSTADCAIQLVKQDGLLGFYRGFEPMICRNAVWNGVYFGFIGTVRDMLPTPKDATKSEQMGYNFITGVIGGTVATIANTPFDVVKSRMQNQLAGAARQYNWTFPSLAALGKEEGIRALYKGLGPRLVRLGPGGGIMLIAFDKVCELLKDF